MACSPYSRNTSAPAPGAVGPVETSQRGNVSARQPGDPYFSQEEAERELAETLGRNHPKARRVAIHPAHRRDQLATNLSGDLAHNRPNGGDLAITAEQGAARAIDSAS